MVYKPEMDKRAQRPKEQAQQGKDISRIAASQEQSTKSIANLLGQQKIANENLETGFVALQKSQKTSFIRRNLDNALEIFYTRKEGTRAHKQRAGYQKEHLKDDKKDRVEFKTSDKKTDLDYEIQSHQADTGEEQVTVLGKIANSFAGPKAEKLSAERSARAKKQHRDALGFAKQSAEEAEEAKVLAEQEKLSWMKFYTRWDIDGTAKMQEAKHLTAEIEKQSEHMKKLREGQEKVGASVDNPVYRKEELKLQKLERARAKTTGSKEAEKTAKARIKELRSQTVLFRMAKGIGKMAGFMGKAAKTVGGKFPSLGKVLMLGVVGALLAFMNSPAMAKAEKFILETLIPKFGTWYDKSFKPMFDGFLKFIEETMIPEIWVGIEQGLTNMEPIFKDIGNIVKELGEGGLLKAFEHTLSLVKNIMILFIDGIGNILKSLGLVDFEGPSAVDAMKKSIKPDWEKWKKNLPWWFPTSMVFPELADRKAKIRMLKEDITQMEYDKKHGTLGSGQGLVTNLAILDAARKKLKELEGVKVDLRTTPDQAAAEIKKEMLARQAREKDKDVITLAQIYGEPRLMGPQMIDNSVRVDQRKNQIGILGAEPLTNQDPLLGFIIGS